MAEARTIDALAMDDLFAALESVSPDNDYPLTLTAKAYDPDGVSPDEGVAYVMTMGEKPRQRMALGYDERDLELMVVCFTTPLRADAGDDSGLTSVDERLRTYAACIHKALMVDVRRGGYAVSTAIAEPTMYEHEEKPPYVAVPVRLHIRTLFGDRFRQS